VKLLVPLAALCAGLTFAAVAGADPNDLSVAYQVNVAHNGVQNDSALVPPFVRRWRVTLPAQVSYPLIAEGKVFATVGDGYSVTPSLYALDQATGQVVWSRPLPIVRAWANAAYDAGRVFVVGNTSYCCTNGVMLAYAADTGALLWTTQLPGQYMFTSPPTAANGVVYTGGSGTGGTLYAVRESDGQLLATQSTMVGDHSSPALSGDGVFVTYACNQDYSFAQTTLAPLWHYSGPCYGGGGKTPVYADGRVYTRDFNGDLVLDALTGSFIRNYGPTNGGGYAPAVDGQAIFTTFPANMLTAQSLDGTPLWSFTGDGQLNTAPLIVNNGMARLAIVGSWWGQLYALDAATGTRIWSTDVGAPISGADEQNVSSPLAGLGVGQGLIVVPALNTLSAYWHDPTAPTITVPDTITVSATSLAGAAVTFAVSASDPDDAATVSCDPVSGSSFPIGTTRVRCTASDTAGNTARASFDVVVQPDTTAPTITAPTIVTAAATSAAGGVVTYTVSTSDPDDTANLTCSPASGSQFPVGTTTVTCTATDGSGNAASASFSVVVSAQGADCNLSHYTATKGTLNLKNANLSGCSLPGVDLTGANATNANLTGAYLDAANLSSATLSQAQLEGAVLTRVNLTGAKLNFANLSGASLTGATLSGVTWNQTTCPDGTNSNNDGGTCTGHLA
jgi:outer membrane protein assembly factor BamB